MTYSVVECDGMSAVIMRPDEANPRFLEVVCRFFDKARAVDYVENENAAFRGVAQKIADEIRPVWNPYDLVASIDAPIQDHGLPDGQKAVFAALKRSADEDSLVSKSAKEISEAASVPTGSVVTHLKALSRNGYIEMHRNGSGRWHPNVYRVLK